MKLSAFIMLPLSIVVASCGGGGADGEPGAGESVSPDALTVVATRDDQAIALIYDAGYSVPEDFFVDERASTSVSYTVHHVLDPSGSYEICSDDFAGAEALERLDNEARSVSGHYVGAYENDRYYEFVRELSYDQDVGNIGDLTSPGYARIFKCGNTSRDGVDRSLLSGYAGQLNTRPLEPEAVSEFAEYLWQFSFFPVREKKVLDSYASGGDGSFEHTLLLGFASTQGTDQCDRIEIIEWRFRAEPESGRVSSEFDLKRTFEAEVVAGVPRICG